MGHAEAFGHGGLELARTCLERCLSLQQAELARFARIIERHYGRPMDIEWGRDGVDGKLYILQARPETVKANDKASYEKAMEWLTFVGMQDFANVPAGALSYGQTKLISLARVLSTEAEVVLLDEPASGIDTKWVDNMLDLVLAIAAQGRTVAIVEHNLKVVTELADHAYFMELGRITAEGTIDDLTNSPRLAAAYFGTV